MTRKESQLLWKTIILFVSSILEFESLLVLLEIILLSIAYLLFNYVIDYETLYCYVLISEGFLILVLNKSAFQKKIVWCFLANNSHEKGIYKFIAGTGLKFCCCYYHLKNSDVNRVPIWNFQMRSDFEE